MTFIQHLIDAFYHFALQIPDTLGQHAPELVKDADKFNPLNGIKAIKLEDFIGMIIRMGIHLGFVFVLVRLIYYPKAKRKDFLFTYFLFSVAIFMMCYLLESVKLEMG